MLYGFMFGQFTEEMLYGFMLVSTCISFMGLCSVTLEMLYAWDYVQSTVEMLYELIYSVYYRKCCCILEDEQHQHANVHVCWAFSFFVLHCEVISCQACYSC